MPRINNKYSKEFKLEIVKIYLAGGISTRELARKNEMKSSTQIKLWLKQYAELGSTAFNEETRGRKAGAGKGRPKEKFSSEQEELRYLRMENEYLKKLKAIKGR